jgi:hypothetical protein
MLPDPSDPPNFGRLLTACQEYSALLARRADQNELSRLAAWISSATAAWNLSGMPHQVGPGGTAIPDPDALRAILRGLSWNFDIPAATITGSAISEVARVAGWPRKS